MRTTKQRRDGKVKARGKKVATSKADDRFHTKPEVRNIVWIRTAGHCELCGTDLTKGFRVGTRMNWGKVAHILPASPNGPPEGCEHSAVEAEALTNDTENLILACQVATRRSIEMQAVIRGRPASTPQGVSPAHQIGCKGGRTSPRRWANFLEPAFRCA